MLTTWSGGVDSPIWWQPRWSDDGARGLFSFRVHGMSRFPYASLNVGLHVGDRTEHVVANRNRCAQALGVPLTHWVFAEQVHGTQVAVVGRADCGAGSDGHVPPIPGADALITGEPGVVIAVMAADCVPVLLYDRRNRVVAAVHSGWRGTVGHIVVKTLARMREVFGTATTDVEAWLGPSIRRCCYEVDRAVASQVAAAFGERFVMRRRGRADRFLVGLAQCIRADLTRAGVPGEQVRDSGVCTSCRVDVLFSHRAEGGRTGRQLAAVCLF
ncbi:laccase domain protein [Alicyclobacillus cellulosilyticus]|uniref:Purine nucleoside phosphorylase n=1 Tax=Alicyclobacillus cellulosilyticus TaxID=1003997 RepID=A0A917K471_9BACL|nr:peptidoglycan editing factor PgeF [Alicyclobacillus cellulosilyticus]GGI97316.1 laccase domain protein [Alicyclobacillus cellulosilyticus]